ncbi:MAG: hypothetical protein J2P15_24240, partial [Micromonosporaceae bacterium]|nr:hypothetical protein [Micromonosporaceae bacterium]
NHPRPSPRMSTSDRPDPASVRSGGRGRQRRRLVPLRRPYRGQPVRVGPRRWPALPLDCVGDAMEDR